jgi:prepilin-type N-terminal cleavage/methylation domain-containing protein
MRQDSGFSLIELLVVVAIGLTVSAMAILPFQAASSTLRADANLRIVEAQLLFAREAAVNQRRAFEVRITHPNLIDVVRQDLPTGTTVVSSARLEHGVQFVRLAATPDTPDGFGGGSAVDFGAATVVRFTADGMFTDGSGNPVNGSIFLARPNEPDTARALTIFGLSARVRSYRWNGDVWRP